MFLRTNEELPKKYSANYETEDDGDSFYPIQDNEVQVLDTKAHSTATNSYSCVQGCSDILYEDSVGDINNTTEQDASSNKDDHDADPSRQIADDTDDMTSNKRTGIRIFDKDGKGGEDGGDARKEEKRSIEDKGMEVESGLKRIDNNVDRSKDSYERKKQEDSKGGEYNGDAGKEEKSSIENEETEEEPGHDERKKQEDTEDDKDARNEEKSYIEDKKERFGSKQNRQEQGW